MSKHTGRCPSAWRLCALIITLALCAGCHRGGGSDSTGVEHSVTNIDPVTVPANSSVTVTVDNVAMGSGAVHEFVFASPASIAIDQIKTGDTVYYYYKASTGEVFGSSSLTFDFWRYYVYLFLGGNTLGGVAPVVHTQAGDYPDGTYEFMLTNLSGGEATVDIYHLEKKDPDFSTGLIDINFIVYTTGEDNPVIPNRAEAETIKDYMNDILGQVGISIGNLNVEFREDPAALAILTDRNSIATFLDTVSSATGGGEGNLGINCFLAPNLPENVLGMDGSVPGPGFLQGTRASGVVAQAVAYGFTAEGHTEHEIDQRIIASVLSHEIGHYLGLFHTTEQDGKLSDPLGDTPECGAENDADGDGRVAPSECEGKGATNLMFWGLSGSFIRSGKFQTELSNQQGEVMNTNPAVL